jgi:hypothetical protein
VGALEEESSKAAGFPREKERGRGRGGREEEASREGNDASMCAFVGRTMAFLGAGRMQLASRLFPICYLLYLARKGRRRAGGQTRARAHGDTRLATPCISGLCLLAAAHYP